MTGMCRTTAVAQTRRGGSRLDDSAAARCGVFPAVAGSSGDVGRVRSTATVDHDNPATRDSPLPRSQTHRCSADWWRWPTLIAGLGGGPALADLAGGGKRAPRHPPTHALSVLSVAARGRAIPKRARTGCRAQCCSCRSRLGLSRVYTATPCICAPNRLRAKRPARSSGPFPVG